MLRRAPAFCLASVVQSLLDPHKAGALSVHLTEKNDGSEEVLSLIDDLPLSPQPTEDGGPSKCVATKGKDMGVVSSDYGQGVLLTSELAGLLDG